MTFVRAWLRLELPRRWRSLVVVTVLVALASGLVLGALAGARRGASAIERLHDRTRPATSAVFTNSADFDWNLIRSLPEVEALSTFVIDYTYSFEGYPDSVLGFPPADAETLTNIETPVVYHGRMWDPARADEVVVTPRFAAHFGKKVGDTVVANLPTVAELAQQSGSGPDGAFTGPHVPMTIVGIIQSPFTGDEPGQPGFVIMSPGATAKYRDNIIGPAGSPKNLWNYVSAIVRLRGGESALPQFRADVARVGHRTDIEVWNLPAGWRAAQREGTFEARCLLAFALAGLAASVVLVGQAVSRYAASSTSDLRPMRAVGVTPRQSIAAATAGPLLAGALGAGLGVVGACVASPIFPIGTARLIEPAPGFSADWVVFGPGLAVITLLVAAGAATAASLNLAAARRDVPARTSAIARAVARSGLPVPAVIGTRFALEKGSGRASVPVRSTLFGAVFGVVGVVAAFTFSHGVSDVVHHPERFGQTHQLEAFIGANGQDFIPAAPLLSVAAGDLDVAGINDSRQAVAAGPDNRGGIPIYNYSGGKRAIPVVLFSGRMPQNADEIVLAPRTMKAQGVSVGSPIELTGAGGRTGRYIVTGEGLLPEGPRNGYAEGGWITPAGYDRLFDGFLFHVLLVSLRPDVDVATGNAALSARIAAAMPEAQGFAFRPPDPPIEVAEIRQVRVLPIALGCFLAVLAVGAVGYALATTVRRRNHEVAVLRALGMTRTQCRGVVATHATLLAVIGVGLGLPMGLALGRTVWRLVAHYTPLQYIAPTATLALVFAAPAALVIANVMAALPSRRAGRLHVAQVLRAE